MEISKEKLQELMEDETFADKWDEATTKEEIQALLKGHGIEATLEEIEALQNSIPEMKENELSDESLENVAGGIIRPIGLGGLGGILSVITGRCPFCGKKTGGIFGHFCKKRLIKF